MAAGSKAREILNYSFLVALADDGIIDDGELAYIKSLAMADGMLDEQEKRTLKRVFSLVDESKLTPEAQKELQEFRSRHKVY
jgi:tellurite resistance protein